MAQEKDYSLKVKLTQLAGAFVKDLTGRTATKKCIIIPVDDNPCMFVGEKDVYLNIAAFANENQQYGDTHMLKPNLPKEVREQMTDEHCLGIPTIFDKKRSNRPFVDWDGVEQLLEMMNVLPATPRTHITVKQPSFMWE